MRYELAKPDDYRRARQAVPVAYLPWGAHEWHGKHNPLGLDTLKTHGHCLALCAETGGVVFPPVYCGHHTMKPYKGFDATIEFSAECVKMLLQEYLQQLSNEGFKVIVLILGHYGSAHVDAIQETVKRFNESQDRAVAWASPDHVLTAPDGIGGDHAGAVETSYMMYFHPELVDLSRLPQDRDLTVDEDGIGGRDPRQYASSKIGRDGTNALVKNAAPKILELLKQKE